MGVKDSKVERKLIYKLITFIMQMQENEHMILDAGNGDFQLSSRRISLQRKEWGLSSKIFINLEDISSIRTIYTHSIILLGLTILCGLATLLACNFNAFTYNDSIGALAGLTALFFVFWYFSKKRIISIHPNGGKPLEFYTKGLAQDQIYDMLEKVQIAKEERIKEINKN